MVDNPHRNYTIAFNAFPTVHGPIDVPANAWFLRGLSRAHATSGRVVGSRPMYFTTDFSVAQGYADAYNSSTGGGVVHWFRTTRPLKLLDLRYIKLLFADLLQHRTAVLPPGEARDFKESLYTLMLAYGMCTFDLQLRLFRERYKAQLASEGGGNGAPDARCAEALRNMESHAQRWDRGDAPAWVHPVEPLGVRIGETENDAFAVLLLKDVFGCIGAQVDGYIAPRMPSPYHMEKGEEINSECVIFDPLAAGMQMVLEEQVRAGEDRMTSVPIQLLVEQRYMLRSFTLASEDIGAWVARGGCGECKGQGPRGAAGRHAAVQAAHAQARTYDPTAYLNTACKKQRAKVGRLERRARRFGDVVRDARMSQVGGATATILSPWPAEGLAPR